MNGRAFKSPTRRKRPKFDVAGAGLLAITLTALVLFTSLGGDTLGWNSPAILGLIAVSQAALAGFVFTEHHAAEPIFPLGLFHHRIFAVSCAVGLIVGRALFGSATYMPLYLQVVKRVSPSLAGMQLTPMMGGVLVSSIISGHLIIRIGRYRMFPIPGAAVMTIGLSLLATLGIETNAWLASGYMLVLGMVMQVLVLAVQNAVDYKDLGVETSDATLFRSIGGSVGVSIFGAIFAAGLTVGLADPLRDATGPDATSLEELQNILARMISHEHLWDTCRRISERLEVKLQPNEIWLLIQLCRQSETPDLDGLATTFAIPRETLAAGAERLQQQALTTRTAHGDLVATDTGRQTFELIVDGYRQRLARFVERWSSEAHVDVRIMLETFARELVEALPREREGTSSDAPTRS